MGRQPFLIVGEGGQEPVQRRTYQHSEEQAHEKDGGQNEEKWPDDLRHALSLQPEQGRGADYGNEHREKEGNQ